MQDRRRDRSRHRQNRRHGERSPSSPSRQKWHLPRRVRSSLSRYSSIPERGRRWMVITGAAWFLAAVVAILGGVGIGALAMRYADYFQRIATPPPVHPRIHRSPRRMDAGAAAAAAAAAEVPYQDSPGFVKNKTTETAPVETCDTDVCLWQGRNLYEKFNESVSPCNDFYSYVCGSTNWYRDSQRIDTRPYRIHSPGQLMLDLADLERRLYRLRAKQYREQPNVFTNQLLFFLSNCTRPEKNESAWVTLKKIFTENMLEGWPFKKDPKVLRISDTSMVLDKYLGLFAFVKVTLRKEFEEDDYEVHLEAPDTPLKRHQLLYPNESVADYAKRVQRILFIFTDASMAKAAEDIVQLEQRLLQLKMPRRFLPYDNRTATIKELQRRNTWHWLTYLNFLLEDAGVQFHRQSSVVVLDREYVGRLALQLSKYSSKTLLNYLGYALLVKFSPLLPSDVDSLVPLSHNNHIETVSHRLQACVHMLEDLCPYWVRKMARMTLSRENVTAPRWHYDEEMHKLVYLVRESMKQTVQLATWLSQAEVDAASKKLEKLRVDFLAARETEQQVNAYYPQFVSPFPADDALLGYYKLLNETMSFYWITNSSFDMDARYQVSSLVAGEVEYIAERNLLFIPHGLIAFASHISDTFDPLFVPFIVPAILRGMFAAIDRRGSTVNVQNQVVNWWSNSSRSKFASKLQCFQDQYAAEMQDHFGLDIDDEFFMDENVADNAVLHPLHDVFRKAMHLARRTPRDSRVPGFESLTVDQLFFVNYAAAHCDGFNANRFRRQVIYKDCVPADLRVNVPLKNYPKFSEVFKCQRNAPMNPENRCELW